MHGRAYDVLITASEARFAPHAQVSAATGSVRFRLLGALSPLRAEPEGEMPGKSNYYVGSDPGAWRTGVTRYASVRVRGVYTGIDLQYHGAGRGEVESDFVVAPGSDPRRIRFTFDGAERACATARSRLRRRPARSLPAGRAPGRRSAASQNWQPGSRTVGSSCGAKTATLPLSSTRGHPAGGMPPGCFQQSRPPSRSCC